MSDQAQDSAGFSEAGKGKGRAPDTMDDVSMGEDEDEEDEEEDEEDENEPEAEDVEAEEDGLEEIDTNNIVTTGRRTRGKVINFAEAAKNTPAEEEEEEDEDYEAPDEEMEG